MPGVRFPVVEQVGVGLSDTLAEWLRRQPAKLLGLSRTGSNPVGVDLESERRRSTTADAVPVAQRIRRETTNLKIAGSNPVRDNVRTNGDNRVLWCNWLSLWTLNPTIRVQIPVEPLFIDIPILFGVCHIPQCGNSRTKARSCGDGKSNEPPAG